MSNLVITAGENLGRRYTLGERTRIGRATDNHVVLADSEVSRYHAEIEREGIHFHLRDLGSKNGVRINGQRVTRQRLRYGDLVEVGGTTFVFQASQDEKTARFSDTLITLETETDAGVQIFPADALPRVQEDHATRLIEQTARLLECSSEDLPQTLQALLMQILEQFDAAAGSILLRARSGEPQPLVAVAEGGRLRLCGQVPSIVLNEGKPLLCSAFPCESDAVLPNHAMIVPLLRQGNALGALHVERHTEGAFRTRDLARMMLIGRVVAGAVRLAIQMDQMQVAAPPESGEPYIGTSALADSVRQRIRRIGASDSTVLLTGETGTGKELVSRAIHAASTRAQRPFVVIDCSAIPPSLMESELFGHEAGAFTGADRLKRGKVEMAEGGTLFLDEIGELQLDLQPKLLRFLEDFHFYRVGGTRPIQADVRIIAATNRNLQQAVDEGKFREDLLYRLNVMPFHLPPLRKRIEDIRPLIDHYAPRLASRVGKPFLGLTDEAWNLLEHYRWPGNVRELRHSLERALILSDDGILRPDHFQLAASEPAIPDSTRRRLSEETLAITEQRGREGEVHIMSLEEAEAEAIRRALSYAQGNQVLAASLLRIHRNTLARKMRQLNIRMD